MSYTHIKIRWMRCLIATLILSLGVNAGILISFIYNRFQKHAPMLSFNQVTSTKESVKEPSLQETVEGFSLLSFRRLASLLSNPSHIEEGYSTRDIALSALMSFRDLDCEAILSSLALRKRVYTFREGKEITLLSGITEGQYEAIIKYVHTEKWPLTAKGLLKLLKAYPDRIDRSLQEAFYVKEEFNLLRMFFHRQDPSLPVQTILELLCEGDYEILYSFTEEQKKGADFSLEKRRQLLLSYIQQGAPTAARLLLQYDFLYAVKKLEDGVILKILELIKEKTQDGEQFCYELLKSGRSDLVVEKSAALLYSFAGEKIPIPYNHAAALKRFIQSDVLRQQWQVEEETKRPLESLLTPKKGRTYKVQEGDTLWKIARKHKLDIDALIELNKIKPEKIRTGTILVLPDELPVKKSNTKE